MASFVGIAIWNSIEMVPLVFLTFTRYRTLYFWSLCVTVTGVLICSAAQIINIWVTNRSNLVPAALSCVGWIPMVTGQSLVLYSRLHLLYIELRTLRLVLIMIIFNAIVVHSAGFILTMGANSNSPDRYIYPYNIFEKVQVTIFFIQEIIISGLYLWKAKEFLGKYSSNLINSQDRSARTIREILTYLIVVNIIVVALDVTILVLEYLGLYLTQLTYKIFVYSVKVKCEVGILNRLIEFVKRSRRLDSNFQITRQMQRERRS
ncbi:uncharacterized protein BCR38DRAFT_457072 [Pseudomassariella vexata]|uniref:DUF7703 domain-containing protein n=1 Tax=Pseudomassariella vexata TaxID=1141098 RepID=A0A1Y2E4S1_9PEZI|nr:uncharacterized protein BCR38DRAFT_457072 [Pseudomassariella vexata]ORY66558.1 hypothetical protein BCR38DRAFT_457072 [Pseudomassariella vexata]